MSTKQHVLSILEKYKGESVSGGRIARDAGISRAAVWKAVDSLRRDGHAIKAVTNKGYMLCPENEILTPESIIPHLNDNSYDIAVFDRVESTNTLLKQRAAEGVPGKSVIIANEQTGGRGRRGHGFYSPKGSGIYLSVLLRPEKMKAADAPVVTTAAAAAICKAVSAVAGSELSIKWINDLFYNGKKVCGILTEAATDFETQNVEYIIIGAGINLVSPAGGFPEDIADVAGAVSERPVDKSRLCAEIINCLDEYISDIKSREFLKEYKKRLFVLNRDITVASPDGNYTARAVDINRNAELVIKTPDGATRVLNAGEISIKGW